MAFRRSMNFLENRLSVRLVRILLASTLGLCAVLLWANIWYVGDSRNQRAAIGVLPADSPTGLPIPAVRAPRAVSTGAVTAVQEGLGKDTIRYYEADTGRAFSLDTRTLRTDTLSDRRLTGFLNSWWIPRDNKVISAFQNASGTLYRFYDYGTQRTAIVGSGIVSLALSPSGRRIAFLSDSGGTRTLFVADADGASPRTVITTRAESAELTWPLENTLVLVSRRTDRAGTDMTIIGLDGTLTPIMSARENLEYAWSRDGSQLLFSYFVPGKGIVLWYRMLSSAVEIPLGVPTAAGKCAWRPDGMGVVCGVPASTSLSRDVPSSRTATSDDIADIDLQSGAQQVVYRAKAGSPLGVSDALVSSSGSFFVFTNVFDRHLYLIELPQ